jgi:hypothetical protein
MASEATTKLRNDLVKRVKEEYNLDSIGVAQQKFKDLSGSDEGKAELVNLLSFGFKGDFQDVKTIICGDASSCVNLPTWKLFSNPFVKWLSLTTQSFTDVVLTTKFENTLEQMSIVDTTAMTDEEWWTWLTADDASFVPSISNPPSDNTGIVFRFLNGIKTKYMTANNLIPRSYLIKNIRRILTDRNMRSTGFTDFLNDCVRMDKNFLLKCGITETLNFGAHEENYNKLKTKSVFGMKGYQDRMIAAIEQTEYADLIKRVHTELVKTEYSDYANTPLVAYINTLNTEANPADSPDPPTPSATYLKIKYLESADMGLVKELMTGGDVSGYPVVRRLFASARSDRTFPPFAQVKNIFYKMNNKEDWNNWIRLLSNPYWSDGSRKEGTGNVDQCYVKHYLCSSSCDASSSASAAPGCPVTYINDRPQNSGSSSKALVAITRLKDDLRKPTSSSQDTSISRTNDLIDHIKYTKYRVMALIVLVIITMYQYANLYTGLRSMSSEIFKGLAVLMIVIIVYFYLSVTISTFWTHTVAPKTTTSQDENEPGETTAEPVPTLSTPNVDITRNAIDAYTRSLPKP